MTTVSSPTASDEATAIDASARCPLGLLTASALLWLVVGGILSGVSLLQLQSPGFLADCAWLTHGRLQAMQETAMIYGWAVNAGLAVALWLLVRLGGEALRGANYAVVGALFWNLALVLGLAGIATGDATSYPLLQMPGYLQPVMLAAYAAMAAPGVLAWTGRRRKTTYATQWYAVAALFLLPWFFSVAQVMLVFAPVRGVLQAVVATWYVQNFYSLWLAPVALAAAYYLVPKLTGRAIPSYDFAVYGFWSLLVFGTWMGGRYLSGGPVPAWIPTIAIVSSVLVLFHHLIVLVNLRAGLRPGGSTVLFFTGAGVLAYVLGGLADAVFATRALAMVTQFTYFQQAQQQLALGAFSLMMFGALYYLGPRLAGRPWPSISLIRGHFLAVFIGLGLLVGSLATAGWLQGQDLNNASVAFADITGRSRAWLQLAAAAQGVTLCGNLLFACHFIQLFARKPALAVTPSATAMEGAAS